jgi:hypothetical protein
MKEKTYPIYTFSAKWIENGKWDPKYPHFYEGLPKGRINNSSSFSKMFKEEKTQEELDVFVKDWWEKYVKITKIKKPELLKLTATFKEYETWYLTWFQHETFDEGQSDKEILDSFERFVKRKEDLGENGCLMGANDRWRWHGAGISGAQEDKGPAPCRCKFCKEQGIIRIAH